VTGGWEAYFLRKKWYSVSIWMLSENVIWARLSHTLIDDSNTEFWKKVTLHSTYSFKVLEMYKARDFCSTFDLISPLFLKLAVMSLACR
jgi:hypothetical protein